MSMPAAFEFECRQPYGAPMKKKALEPHQLEECARLKEIFQRKKAELGLTQDKAAAALGMNQGSFSHYLNGRNALNLDFAVRVARLLKVSVVDFSVRLQLEIYALATSSSEVAGVTELRDHLALSRLAEQGDERSIGLVEKYLVGAYDSSPSEVERYQTLNEMGGLSTTLNVGPRGYWIEVIGPSMASFKAPSFPEGSFVLIQPDGFEIISGKFYLAKHKSGERAFKQLLLDAGRLLLTSLNASFSPVEMTEEWEIIGRIVDVKILDL